VAACYTFRYQNGGLPIELPKKVYMMPPPELKNPLGINKFYKEQASVIHIRVIVGLIQ
jgi:hypothetical protein